MDKEKQKEDLTYPTIHDLVERAGRFSRYELVLLATLRAKQLISNTLGPNQPYKPLSMALKEIAEGKIDLNRIKIIDEQDKEVEGALSMRDMVTLASGLSLVDKEEPSIFMEEEEVVEEEEEGLAPAEEEIEPEEE